MKLTDPKINEALHNNGYIRRSYWKEKTACIHLAYDGVMEFGYRNGTQLQELAEDNPDRYTLAYEDIVAEDWEIMA